MSNVEVIDADLQRRKLHGKSKITAMVASDISNNCWPIIDPAVLMTKEQTNER